MTAIACPPVSPTEMAQQVVKLMDSEGYTRSVALLVAHPYFEGISWETFKDQVGPIVEELRPDNAHRKQPTHAANVHKALEEKERRADQDY